jgi:hypothetical protein
MKGKGRQRCRSFFVVRSFGIKCEGIRNNWEGGKFGGGGKVVYWGGNRLELRDNRNMGGEFMHNKKTTTLNGFAEERGGGAEGAVEGRAHNKETITAAEFAEYWLNSVIRGGVRQSSFAAYRGHIENHIKRLLGGERLREIKAERVQGFVAALSGEGLSSGTVRAVTLTLKAVLKCAADYGYISENPCGRRNDGNLYTAVHARDEPDRTSLARNTDGRFRKQVFAND